jgi:hypothetical protein
MINYLDSNSCSEQAQADVVEENLEMIKAKLNDELDLNPFKLKRN